MESDLHSKKYICVIDMELTCDLAPLPKEEQEIIEIGIEVLDSKTLKCVYTAQTTVKPLRNPTLSEYCKNLTHITQEEIDESLDLDMAVFYLLENNNLSVDDFIWCAWGDDPIWLQKELWIQGSKIVFDKRFINLSLIDGHRRSLSKALAANNIIQQQPIHRALPDAMSTADLARKYKITVEDIQISNTRTYKQQITDNQKAAIDKFSIQCRISKEAAKYILKNFNWNYSKAKHLFTLLDME